MLVLGGFKKGGKGFVLGLGIWGREFVLEMVKKFTLGGRSVLEGLRRRGDFFWVNKFGGIC